MPAQRSSWLAYLELTKPITWFPPMWAFACGLVAAGSDLLPRLWFVAGGVLLAGPLVCGTSQIVNDWFDRHVDAINEPNRPIPSGRVPGKRGLVFAIIWTVVSFAIAVLLGPVVAVAAVFGLLLAWMYSAPPFRLKANGWWGNSAVGICYEGLPWFTAVAVLTATMPSTANIAVALLYSLGAHGIMTLNDFKSIEGDKKMNLLSLPVQLGADLAARFACGVMLVAQLTVVVLLTIWQHPWHAAAVAASTLVQAVLMRRLLSDPEKFAPWYNATGISLYVSGMMVTAFALRSQVAG